MKSKQPKRILVTGAGGSAAHNFIESLRNNPYEEPFYIVGTDINKYHLELAKVDKKYIVPQVDEPKYLKIIQEIIKKERIDFLHCQPEQDVIFFSKHKKDINTKTLLPNHKTVELCQNKIKFNEELMLKNISVPQAYYIKSEKDIEVGLSSILKTNEKAWLRAIHGAGSRAALPVKKVEHAKMWIDYWREMKGLSYGDFMLSEFLPGKEYAFQSVWKDGEILVSQARLRVEYLFGNLFVSGQSSSPSVAMTINNEDVNKMSYDAIKAIDKKASGIFCVDLKTDKKGKILITEINTGRFFTTSYFFSKAGCNMPYYYTKLGLGDIKSIPYKPFNNLKAGLFWVRMVDMGYKLIYDRKWIKQVK